jgi:hypothetical protein
LEENIAIAVAEGIALGRKEAHELANAQLKVKIKEVQNFENQDPTGGRPKRR